jgi:hypothetical protein
MALIIMWVGKKKTRVFGLTRQAWLKRLAEAMELALRGGKR